MKTFHFTIAGTFASDYKQFRGDIPAGTPVLLRRQPDNPHDPNAIEVSIRRADVEEDVLPAPGPDGVLHPVYKLGMVPAKRGMRDGAPFNWAAFLAPIMDRGETVAATFEREFPKVMLDIAVVIG